MLSEATTVRDRIKSLRRVRAGDLIPHPKNWRRHPAGQVAVMRAALTEIGFADALLVRETKKGLQIIDGHLRAELNPDQKVPVLVLDVTAKEADKLLATFDPITGMAETDIEQLSALAGTLDFEVPELADLVAATLGDTGSGDITEDDPPAPRDGPCVAKVGDVWACGRHRVLCGDATDEADVAALLGGARPSLVVTDPPYGMAYAGCTGEGVAQPGMRPEQRRSVEPITGDELPFDPMPALELSRCREWYVWGGDWFYDKLPSGGSWIVWDKRATEAADAIPGSPFEVCWSKNRHARAFIRKAWGGWYNKQDGDKRWHPTQKPVECMAYPMERHDGDVYDPFLGSGTTLIAAEQLGRTCYGIEIEPKYIDVILQRYMNFTNVSPVRESDGALFSELVKPEAVSA